MHGIKRHTNVVLTRQIQVHMKKYVPPVLTTYSVSAMVGKMIPYKISTDIKPMTRSFANVYNIIVYM